MKFLSIHKDHIFKLLKFFVIQYQKKKGGAQVDTAFLYVRCRVGHYNERIKYIWIQWYKSLYVYEKLFWAQTLLEGKIVIDKFLTNLSHEIFLFNR